MYKSYIERNNSACSLVLQTGKIARKKGEKERGEGAELAEKTQVPKLSSSSTQTTNLREEEFICSISPELGPSGRICWDLELGLLVRAV